MRKLDERASGLRHLRWAREILATLDAHHEHDARLDPNARALVLAEAVDLRAEIRALSEAVKAYRDFLERTRTQMRGLVRVGRYLVSTAKTAEERTDASAIDAELSETFARFEAKERAPRKRAVRDGVIAMRAHLDAMDARIGAVSIDLLDSLYPELTADASRVADDGDEDDDAAARD